MDGAAYQDLVRVDRDVARAVRALGVWREGLDKDPDAHADEEPLGPFRHVAGRAAYLAVLGDPAAPKGADAPVREGLARWIAHLTLARLVQSLEVDRARAAAAAEGRYALEPRRRVAYREAWRALPSAKTRAEVAAWLDAAAERAGDVGAPARERRARREEAASRLRAPGAWGLATPIPHAAVLAACEELLVATRALAGDVLKEARAKSDSPKQRSPFDALALAVARDAPEGWPARLQPRWLHDLFPRLADGLRLELGPLPVAAGASSFARALGAFGFALRTAGPAPSLPFAVARDPSHVDAHRYAAVFASLAASAEFQRRALGNVARVADAQARVMGRSLLFSARLAAARVLLAHDADRFEELTTDVFGAALPAPLALAWPDVRDDEPSRAVALLTAVPLARELVERFDADWFRNPRAVLYLRARASAPAWDPSSELEPSAARALARAFEEATA
jgi:hypothetical protein